MTTTTYSLDYMNELAATTPVTPCPAWCRLRVGHGWDGLDTDTGLLHRGHAGPDLGDMVFVGGQEKSDRPGVIVRDCGLEVPEELTVKDLRDLVVQAEAAAKWLEEVQR